MYRQKSEQPHFAANHNNNNFFHHEQSLQCDNCVTYEEDIAILQEKLMETHNKLIEQIDICRQQEVKILKMMKQRSEGQQNNYNENNLREKGKKVGKIKKYDDDFEYQHSIEPLVEAKTELLRNDLQAMRNKVLTEIMKSNKLQEKSRELQAKHDKQIIEFRDRIRKLEQSRGKLIDQNETLREDNDRFKRQIQNKKHQSLPKCTCGFELKYYDLDQAFMSQRTVTNQLIEKNSYLENQIHDLRTKAKQNEYHTQGFGRVEQIRTEPKRKEKRLGREATREEFEQTKNLIKKLEVAEKQIRTRKYEN